MRKTPDFQLHNAAYMRYRWVIELLVILAMLAFTLLWLSPSPLLTVIMDELYISYAQAGLAVSVVALFVFFFAFSGSFLTSKMGPKTALSFGLFVLGIGGCLVFWAQSYAFFIFARIIIGIGFGISLGIPGAMIMQWFTPEEKPYISTVNSVIAYIGMSIAFSATVPLFFALGTWQSALAVYGIYALVVALLWSFLGKENKFSSSHAASNQNNANVDEKSRPGRATSPLQAVLQKRDIWLITITMVGSLWTFQTFSAFLPTFFQTVRAMDMGTASAITSIITIVGIAAGLLCGIIMSLIGLRKIFIWPLHILILLGCIGALIFQQGPVLYVSVGLIGFGQAGRAPALFTIPMEIKEMSPAMVGAAYSLIFGSGYGAGFISPIAAGWLSSHIGLQQTLFIFAFAQILPIICAFLLPETGPRMQKIAAAKT